MQKIYVTGHRNPDMDSICSAIGYANLKNLIDPGNEYIPVRCSHIGESVKQMMNALNIEKPVYLQDVFTKVKDVTITTDIKVEADAPLTEYAKLMAEENHPVMAVFNNDRFYGLISVDDVTHWGMKNLAEKGEISDVPLVREIMSTESEIVPSEVLQADDLFEEGKRMLSASDHRGIAVFSGSKYVGYVTRRCFLNMPKHNVILVDHNETSQSVRGIDTANVVEIIDHHRLNAMKTSLPLFIDAEPLGSTCTIVYQLYLRNGIRPAREIAKILLTGILSDTLILKSPTTTRIDIESAWALAAMCETTVEEYGGQMFGVIKGLASREPVAAISSDFKIYKENKINIGIGQCEVTNLQNFENYCGQYIEALETVRKNEGLDWAMLMITDVLKEQSILLSTAFPSEKRLPYKQVSAHIYDMPGVMSRKKQLLPEVLHAAGLE